MTTSLRNIVVCLICYDVIESLYRHDFKWCSCGNVAVDGGNEYHKRSFKTDKWIDYYNIPPLPKGTIKL